MTSADVPPDEDHAGGVPKMLADAVDQVVKRCTDTHTPAFIDIRHAAPPGEGIEVDGPHDGR